MDGHLEGNTKRGLLGTCRLGPALQGDHGEIGETSQKAAGASPDSGPRRRTVLCPRPETAYFEKADARITGGRCEVLVVVKVDVAQAPGVCKLLPAAIKNPRAAQVPAWPGDREQRHPKRSRPR